MRKYISIVALLFLHCSQPQLTLQITISGNPSAVEIPVEIATDEMPQGNFAGFVSSGAPIELQEAPSLFFSKSGKEMKRALCAILPAGVLSQRVELEKSSTPSHFKFEELEGEHLQLSEGDQPVFVYNFGMQLPEGVPEDRRRSTYIHPVYDLNGTVVTDDFPEDHYHHRGLSWMWPKVFIGGERYDLWAIQGIRQHFEEWLAQEVGPICATLGVKNGWRLDDGRKVMDEWVWVRAYRASNLGRVLDVAFTLEALEPIELQGADRKGYGGFCFRFAPRRDVVITSPEGVEAEDVLHKNFVWADQSARFRDSEKVSGVAVFQHAENPDFPSAWILRHYGFTGVCWPGLEKATLQPGKPITLRYRVWIHKDDAAAGKVADAYEAFAQPPKIDVSM